MNDWLISLNFLLMALMPVAVAWFIHRRTGASWRFFVIGAVTFVVAQMFHIPFNRLVLRSNLIPVDFSLWSNLLWYALFIGLSAGVFEETARYLSYRFWARDARTWSRGLMLGSGHGGIEAILLGVLAAINFAGLLLVSGNDGLLQSLPLEQQTAIREALSTIDATPWHGLLLGAVERLLAIIAHLALSILVLQAFTRRAIRWLFWAIGYHALFDMTAVISAVRWGPYTTEGLLAIWAIIGLGLIFGLRTPEPPAPAPDKPPEGSPGELPPLKPTAEALERSRYLD